MLKSLKFRGLVPLLAVVAAGTLSGAAEPPLNHYVGSLHEHSAYSDGFPASHPEDYLDSGKRFGLDFMGSSEHSDNLNVPQTFSTYCAGREEAIECQNADRKNPANALRKWDALEEYHRNGSTDGFTAFRGFEWTSDRFGHINVFFSGNQTNAKVDGGYADMDTFWRWFTTPPVATPSDNGNAGGGGDGLGVFNHPGAKDLGVKADEPNFNWENFKYVPEADGRMVGIETFNDRRDYGSRGGPGDAGYYAQALDAGWHVGAVGAEDLGHNPNEGDGGDNDWGGPVWPKTVIMAPDRSPASLRAAMLARRFYSVRTPNVRLGFEVDGKMMGARLQRTAGDRLAVDATVNDPAAELDLVTARGRVVATGTEGRLHVERPASLDERYLYVRARKGSEPIAYSSPVWIEPRAADPPPQPGWLAGDLHVHTCFSHDAYCGPDDDNTGPDEAYAAGVPVAQRFSEAKARGLDYLAITDHNDLRSASDAGFATQGVIGVPGYENSLNGHAQVLGAKRLYDNGAKSAGDVNRLADEVRADGGLFQINHPAYRIERAFDRCDQTDNLDWGYGYAIRPDVIEVMNPAGTSDVTARRYWECWLSRGGRIGATGGSDSHFAALAAAQGAGNPTTHAFARERSAAGVQSAIQAGRTTISRKAPGQGGGRLLLEADGDRNGTFEAIVGDAVPEASPLRVRSEGGEAGTAVVRAGRAGGEAAEILRQPLAPGAQVELRAPEGGAGWVRAMLETAPETDAGRQCEPGGDGRSRLPSCPTDQTTAAVTSPIYLTSRPAPGGPPPGGGPSKPGRRCASSQAGITRTRIAAARLGQTRRRMRQALRAEPLAERAKVASFCVTGGGTLSATFPRGGRAQVIVTTARRHRARGVGRGTPYRRLRRAFPGARRIDFGAVWAGGNSRVVFGVRTGRVRYVAVVVHRVRSSRRLLRRELGRLGLNPGPPRRR